MNLDQLPQRWRDDRLLLSDRHKLERGARVVADGDSAGLVTALV